MFEIISQFFLKKITVGQPDKMESQTREPANLLSKKAQE